MKGSSFFYLLREGVKNVYVNRLMSFASIGTLVACMLLIGSSMLFSMNVNSIVGYVEKIIYVVIEVSSDLDEEELEALDVQISMIDNIYEQTFISKEELLKEQMAQSNELENLLEDLENDNPLWDSYRVRVKDQGRMGETVTVLQSLDGVVQVWAPTDVAEIVTSIKRAVSTGGYCIVGILIVVSLVIIANTIKVTVFNRRKEISIMKCVGATNSFIRLPFVIEGFIIGLFSSLVAFGLLWLGYDYVLQLISINASPWIQQGYQNMVIFKDVATDLLTYFMSGGVGIGVFGSLFFVSKYLKV